MTAIKAGDVVRVKQSGGGLGPTKYKVACVEGFAVSVREIAGDGSLYREQWTDRDLLEKHAPAVDKDQIRARCEAGTLGYSSGIAYLKKEYGMTETEADDFLIPRKK